MIIWWRWWEGFIWTDILTWHFRNVIVLLHQHMIPFNLFSSLKYYIQLLFFSLYKVRCVFPMVVITMLPYAELGLNDHREAVPHFSYYLLIIGGVGIAVDFWLGRIPNTVEKILNGRWASSKNFETKFWTLDGAVFRFDSRSLLKRHRSVLK